MANKVDGMILYSIELNGCLNGVYTNEHAQGFIYNEIARKKKYIREEEGIIDGEYDCFHFEGSNSLRNNTELIITKISNSEGFDFIWFVKNSTIPKFKGIGYRMNEKQLAVHYCEC